MNKKLAKEFSKCHRIIKQHIENKTEISKQNLENVKVSKLGMEVILKIYAMILIN